MRVATDIGGTFTDVVTLDRDDIHGWKVLSTPASPDAQLFRRPRGKLLSSTRRWVEDGGNGHPRNLSTPDSSIDNLARSREHSWS